MNPARASSGPDLIRARFNPDALSAWTPTRTFFVDPALCQRYAAATNEAAQRCGSASVVAAA